jgi:hypothetical protein
MSVTVGLICGKDGFGYTTVDDTGGIEDGSIEVPKNKPVRGEQLEWFLDEAARLFERLGSPSMAVKHSPGGAYAAAPERYEVEAVVQIAAHRTGSTCRLLTTEGARSAMGVKQASGAYKALLARPDIKARSNNAKREQYLYALAAAKADGR